MPATQGEINLGFQTEKATLSPFPAPPSYAFVPSPLLSVNREVLLQSKISHSISFPFLYKKAVLTKLESSLVSIIKINSQKSPPKAQQTKEKTEHNIESESGNEMLLKSCLLSLGLFSFHPTSSDSRGSGRILPTDTAMRVILCRAADSSGGIFPGLSSVPSKNSCPLSTSARALLGNRDFADITKLR